jgi:hypothetical protein
LQVAKRIMAEGKVEALSDVPGGTHYLLGRLFEALFPYLTLYIATHIYGEEEAHKDIGECWETCRSTLMIASIAQSTIILAGTKGKDHSSIAEITTQIIARSSDAPGSFIEFSVKELGHYHKLSRAKSYTKSTYWAEEAQRREWIRLDPAASQEIISIEETGQFPLLQEAQRITQLAFREEIHLGHLRGVVRRCFYFFVKKPLKY